MRGGYWLKAFLDEDSQICCKGIDGDWLKGQQLMIPEECIEYTDLSIYEPKQKYDMAISLEVAEHLDSKYAERFITTLTSSSDIIVFSAAIPQQGGTGHVNERWQGYWVDLFKKRNYEMVDFIRPLIWTDDDAGIYRQNILVFIHTDIVDDYKNAIRDISATNNMIDVVHPVLYSEHKVARKFKEESENNYELSCKNRYLFEVVAAWMNKKLNGKNMSDYLLQNGVGETAIYGAGILGECVYKEIHDSIQVLYVTDLYKDSFEQPVPFYKYMNNVELPYAKNIIVTAPCDFSKIKSELKLRFLEDICILNIADIIHEM